MEDVKAFFNDVGNWIFNNLIRLNPQVKTIVLFICFSIILS